MRIIFLIIVVVLIALAAFGLTLVVNKNGQTNTPILQTQTSASLTELAAQPYVNTKEGFKIYPPKGWSIDDSGIAGTKVAITDKQHMYGGLYGGSINVMSFHAERDLDYYANDLINLNPNPTNIKVLEKENIILKGREARLLTSTLIENGQEGETFSLLVIINKNAYIITALALESKWNLYEKITKDSLMTFDSI